MVPIPRSLFVTNVPMIFVKNSGELVPKELVILPLTLYAIYMISGYFYNGDNIIIVVAYNTYRPP